MRRVTMFSSAAAGAFACLIGFVAPVSAATPSAAIVHAVDVPVSMPGGAIPVTPQRILDTRSGNGAAAHTIAAGGTVTFTVAGRGGIPATGASGAFLNVTVTGPTKAGSLAAYPAGGSSTSSNLNFSVAQTVPNLVFVPFGTGANAGKVTLKNQSAGTLHVIADTAGYVLAGAATNPGASVAVAPERVLDTRTGNGAPAHTVAAGGTVTVTVAGRGNIPAEGASGAFVNVTVTGPTKAGSLAAYPAGGSSTSSNLNFAAAQTVPNLVFVPFGTGANAGKVTLKNQSTGTLHVIADTAGYVLTGTATDPGAAVAVAPQRVLDTRSGLGTFGAHVIAPGGTVTFTVADRGNIPANGVSGAFLNVTVTSPTKAGSLAAYAAGGSSTSSNLNFAAGKTVPNLVLVPLGKGISNGGRVTLKNQSTGTLHVIADTAGYVSKVDDGTEPTFKTVTSKGLLLSVTADGRYVLYRGDGEESLWVWDRQADTREKLLDWPEGSDVLGGADISADGRYVIFMRSYSNPEQLPDIAMIDRSTSPHTGIGVGTVGRPDDKLVLSADGKYVTYATVLEDTGETRIVQVQTQVIANGPDIPTDFEDALLDVSSDGRFILYDSFDGLKVYDKTTFTSTPVNNPNPDAASSGSISLDGRYVAYLEQTDETNFGGITSLWDRNTGTSTSLNNQTVDDFSVPTISDDGQFLSFVTGSMASGTNTLVLRDRSTGIDRTIDTNSAGNAYQPLLSADGSWLAFNLFDYANHEDPIFAWGANPAAG